MRANLGYALAQAGRLEEAIPEYRAALKLDPLDARTRYHLIEALMASRRYGEASAEVQRAADVGVAIPRSIRERLHRQLGTSPVPAK